MHRDWYDYLLNIVTGVLVMVIIGSLVFAGWAIWDIATSPQLKVTSC